MNKQTDERWYFSVWAKGALALIGLTAILTVSCNSAMAGVGGSGDVSIKSFRLLEIESAVGVIDDDLKQIIITVPNDAGEKVRDATPEITFAGERIEPETAVKQDFTRYVNYKVYGKDGTVLTYTVSTRYTDNPAEITSFTVNAQGTAYSGVLSLEGGAEGGISLTIPSSTDLTNITATIGVVAGYRLEAGKAVSPAGTPNTYNVAADDFNNEITYTVTNDINTRVYIVRLSFSSPEEKVKKIVSFTIPEKQISSEVNQELGTIAVKLNNALLNNVNSEAKKTEVLSSLTPSIAFVGAKIEPANMTTHDFSKGPIVYKVYGSDSDSEPKTYTVTVDFPVYGEDFEHIKLDLASLQITSEGHDYKNFPLSLHFNTNVTEYDVATEAVPTAALKLIVGATPADNGATIRYVEANLPLRAGQSFSTKDFDRQKKNTVTIRVENTVSGVPSSRDYVINVYRGSNNTDLTKLEAAPVTGTYDWLLYPAFDKNTQVYTLLSKSFSWDGRLKFKTALADAKAHLTVTRGTYSAPYTDTLEVAIPADNTANKIPAMQTGDDLRVQNLPADYTVTLKVTAEDREAVKEYEIHDFAWINPSHPKGKVPVAGGGTVSYVGNDEVHVFETDKIWTEVKDTLYIPFLARVGGSGRVLLLGGGGAGGANHHNSVTANDNGGGGGAGQVVEDKSFAFTKTSYDVTVGAGGKQMKYVVSGSNGETGNYPGNAGTASVFGGKTASGGGGGGGATKQRSGYSYNQPGKLLASGVPEGGNGQKDSDHNGGGAGAGAGGNGISINWHSISGPGISSDITGTQTEYGKGGHTIDELDGLAGIGNWGGGNGGNAERYSTSDHKGKGQDKLGVSSDRGDGYGNQNYSYVSIQGGNGVVIVRIPRK